MSLGLALVKLIRAERKSFEAAQLYNKTREEFYQDKLAGKYHLECASEDSVLADGKMLEAIEAYNIEMQQVLHKNK